MWRRSLLDVRFALGAPQDALVAKEKLPSELAVHVDAVAALDKAALRAGGSRVFGDEVDGSAQFKFTVKRRSQPSLSPGGVSGAWRGAAAPVRRVGWERDLFPSFSIRGMSRAAVR